MSLTDDPAVTEVDPTGLVSPKLIQQRSGSSLARRFLRHPVGAPAIGFLVLVVLAVILAPLLAPDDPQAQDFSQVLSGPTSAHPFGADQLGRDVLSRLLYGGRITLIGVAEAVVVALVIGLLLGLLAGYLGGRTDSALSRVIEVAMAIPGIVVLLIVFSLFDNNQYWAMLALGLLSVPVIFRVTRAASLAVRSEAYVTSAQITGVSQVGIMRRHILPRIYGPLIVNTAVLAAVVLGIQTGLNFLGLGVTPPAPSWGGSIAEAQASLQEQPWLIVPSALTTGLTILALVLLGDSLRDLISERSTSQAGRRASTQQPPAPLSGLVQPNETAPDLLEVRGLDVSFGAGDAALRVVQDVAFSIGAGEAVGIVGESGCGKSVTSAAVLGFLARGGVVTRGSVLFDGDDILTMSDGSRAKLRGRRIGYVSQEPLTSLDPCFTVGSQLGELVKVHEHLPSKQRRARVLELLSQVGLPDPDDTARRYPHQISGGMAQRVSIAAALAGRPVLLVADEPTTALDVTVQAEILELLRTLIADTNMSVMIITHDLGVVADLCSRAVVMYAGEVVEIGTVQELTRAPAHPYTKALLAANPAFGEIGSPLPAISGTVPAPSDWPRGCHFAARCGYRVAACEEAPVPLLTASGGRVARCIRVEDLLAESTS